MEGFPVVWGKPELPDSLYVLPGRISHIPVPAVLRIFNRQPSHIFIPVCLCQDGCGGDGCEPGIPFHDAGIRDTVIFSGKPAGGLPSFLCPHIYPVSVQGDAAFFLQQGPDEPER